MKYGIIDILKLCKICSRTQWCHFVYWKLLEAVDALSRSIDFNSHSIFFMFCSDMNYFIFLDSLTADAEVNFNHVLFCLLPQRTLIIFLSTSLKKETFFAISFASGLNLEIKITKSCKKIGERKPLDDVTAPRRGDWVPTVGKSCSSTR